MSLSSLTAGVKKKVTADWNALFPSFGVHKPMRLMRRVGPLVAMLRT